MKLEWIHCLKGRNGTIPAFPAEMLAEKNLPGVTFRLAESGIKIVPDFRARDVFFNGKTVLAPVFLEENVPAFLRLGKNLFALCATSRESASDWAKHYRFPLWTLFEPESLDAIETVRAPQEISAALLRNRLRPEDCLAAPYGLPVTLPLVSVIDLF